MKIKLKTYADQCTMQKAVGAPDSCSIAKLIALTAENICPAQQDFICIIAKPMIAASYQSNPSLLSSKIRSFAPSFEDNSGSISSAGNCIEITLYRTARNRSEPWQARVRGSLKQRIKDVVVRDKDILEIPVEDVPPFLRTHPEQLSYQIHRETAERIKINRTPTHWTIKLATLQ